MSEDTNMNWDDPAERFRLADRVGTDEYNRLFEEHRKESVVSTVNGYDIRPVGSRFGTIFMVEGTDTGYLKQEDAEEFARKQPPKAVEEAAPTSSSMRM
jgi:hypothetical protein